MWLMFCSMIVPDDMFEANQCEVIIHQKFSLMRISNAKRAMETISIVEGKENDSIFIQ